LSTQARGQAVLLPGSSWLDLGIRPSGPQLRSLGTADGLSTAAEHPRFPSRPHRAQAVADSPAGRLVGWTQRVQLLLR